VHSIHQKHIDENINHVVTRDPPELHALACFVHGALTALHVLGAIYNCRRRNWRDVVVHVAAAAYDARSVRHHYRKEQIGLRRAAAAERHRLVQMNVDEDDQDDLYQEPRFATAGARGLRPNLRG
jgi:hypothetical protein